MVIWQTFDLYNLRGMPSYLLVFNPGPLFNVNTLNRGWAGYAYLYVLGYKRLHLGGTLCKYTPVINGFCQVPRTDFVEYLRMLAPPSIDSPYAIVGGKYRGSNR